MSRDLLMLNVLGAVESVSQLTGSSLRPLGSRDHVLNVIREAFPNTDVSDPKWIVVARQDYSLSFSLGSEEPLEALLITVHGKSGALNEIKRLCRLTHWRAYDSSIGEFLNFS